MVEGGMEHPFMDSQHICIAIYPVGKFSVITWVVSAGPTQPRGEAINVPPTGEDTRNQKQTCEVTLLQDLETRFKRRFLTLGSNQDHELLSSSP